MTCEQRVEPGESRNKDLEELVSATGKIWKRIQAKTVSMKNPGGDVVKMPLNGDVRKLFAADGIAAAEKTTLRA